MSKKQSDKEDMLDYYDFSRGIRGKYVGRATKGRTACVNGRSGAKNGARVTRTNAAIASKSDSSDITANEA